jgi:CheY-like chemotaxis protein
MTIRSRFDPSLSAVYTAIVITTATVFVIDLMTRLGVSTWIFYVFPLALCMLARKPMLPIWLAFVCTVLVVIDYFYSPVGIDPWIARLNRGFGLILLWSTALLVRTIIVTQASLRHQNWLRGSQLQIAERVRGDQQLRELGRNTLSLLIDQLRAQAGAIYVMDGVRYTRIAVSGAISAGQDASELSFAPGEGLVGLAATRNSAYFVGAVPAGYFPLRSGLGSHTPTQLLFSPLMSNSAVVGVAEFAFFGEPPAGSIELMDLVAEDLGIALKTAMLNALRQELLEETQRQAEELQAQQEELRVSNEELEQHSNNLRESQARLELQQSEMEQTNTQLEHHSNLLARHNQDLAAAKRDLDDKAGALERANQYKSEFLANMSHELRTPLNSSLILAKLLADNRDGNLNAEQIKFARNIYSSGNDLLELINDILDLSKVETGKVDFVLESLDLRKLCEALVQTVRPLAEQRGIGCRLLFDDDAPRQIETDSQRVRQILRNLLSNAIKFTERGEVTLTVSALGPDGVGFAVRDTGIGIAPQQRDIIWEPFRQADGTTSRKYGGTGLGLSISKELSALLGGNIGLESEVGKGSTFTLVLPRSFPAGRASLDTPQAATREERGAVETLSVPRSSRVAPQARIEGHKEKPGLVADDRAEIGEQDRVLLVIEDDPAFAEIIYTLAHQSGFRCIVAGTADEGIEMAQRYRPTAITLDVRLPDHSGLAVLDRLKHNSATRHIPVQVVSAADYTQSALEMGAAGVMIKPVQPDELLAALDKLESKRTREPRSVLVVEDNQIQRDSVCELLSSQSVRTVPVASASQALDQLRENTFDCMVLDLALPDASGYELLEMMARDERYSFPPVIVYTGRVLSADEELRLRRYSTSIIIKGAKSPERLLDEVTLFLHQVESALPPDRQRMLREARSREAALEGRDILLVEDDVRNVFALTSILEPAGAKITIARNGREALEALRPGHSIDLVLMDVMMPEMDGLEATRRIRAQPALARLPIISLTAKAMPDDRRRCLDAGANDYVTKPIDVEKLLSLIRVWLPRGKT